VKKILVATDGTGPSCEAVETGVELAVEQGVDVAFLHVLPADHRRATPLGGGQPGQRRLEVTDEDELLHEAAAVAAERGVPYTLELLAGDAADEIVRYADETGADLIVVGSRGRRSVAGALLGSTSRAVLSMARRPVLIVRGPRPPV
jgi:nucleotide-binding universal stress UspA family protein